MVEGWRAFMVDPGICPSRRFGGKSMVRQYCIMRRFCGIMLGVERLVSFISIALFPCL